jgi:hypothetical protein
MRQAQNAPHRLFAQNAQKTLTKPPDAFYAVIKGCGDRRGPRKTYGLGHLN